MCGFQFPFLAGEEPELLHCRRLSIYVLCFIVDACLYYMSFERGSTVFHKEQEVGAVALSGIL